MSNEDFSSGFNYQTGEEMNSVRSNRSINSYSLIHSSSSTIELTLNQSLISSDMTSSSSSSTKIQSSGSITQKIPSSKSDNSSNCTIFVGDLTSSCDKNHLFEAFVRFGEIDDLRMIRTKENKGLFGFVKFKDHQQAQVALTSMNGFNLLGRALRVNWAEEEHKSSERCGGSSGSRGRRSKFDTIFEAVVHVKYHTCLNSNDQIISESKMRELFSSFGQPTDIYLKKQFTYSKTGQRSGYAFIHYTNDDAGIETSILTTNYFKSGRVVDSVFYTCSIGKSLQTYLDSINKDINLLNMSNSNLSSFTDVPGLTGESVATFSTNSYEISPGGFSDKSFSANEVKDFVDINLPSAENLRTIAHVDEQDEESSTYSVRQPRQRSNRSYNLIHSVVAPTQHASSNGYPSHYATQVYSVYCDYNQIPRQQYYQTAVGGVASLPMSAAEVPVQFNNAYHNNQQFQQNQIYSYMPVVHSLQQQQFPQNNQGFNFSYAQQRGLANNHYQIHQQQQQQQQYYISHSENAKKG
eukprot:gene5472-7577_t